jgi:hypothetical protein
MSVKPTAPASHKPYPGSTQGTAALRAKLVDLQRRINELLAASDVSAAQHRPGRKTSSRAAAVVDLPQTMPGGMSTPVHQIQAKHLAPYASPQAATQSAAEQIGQKKACPTPGLFASLGGVPSGQWEDVFFGTPLDYARVHWLAGRWDALADIDLVQIENNPERARLALFAAVGWMSKKDPAQARLYMQAAVRYGCPRALIARVLLSGAHAALASAYSLAGKDGLSLKHLTSAQEIIPVDPHHGLGSVGPKRLGEPSAGLDFSLPPRLRTLASASVASPNPTEAVAQALRSHRFTTRERFVFLRELALQFLKAGNKMAAAGFLAEASHLCGGLPEGYRLAVVKDLLGMGLREDAFEVALRGVGTQAGFTAEEKLKLGEARDTLQEKIYNIRGHGHELLLSFLSAKARAQLRSNRSSPPTIIEIGTTRENVGGQGSTHRFMEFCGKHGFHFITVDMDLANVQTASQMFRENGVAFEAIHAKGEDYLAAYDGDMDCVFLDAYDFDHGKHTELRQSRYEKFLGARISDTDCHKMHLECAQAIVKKMQPWTVVCMDDTWLDAGHWTAKGTLSMPYFLEHGLRLLDVRNKSALLGGKAWFPTTTR